MVRWSCYGSLGKKLPEDRRNSTGLHKAQKSDHIIDVLKNECQFLSQQELLSPLMCLTMLPLEDTALKHMNDHLDELSSWKIYCWRKASSYYTLGW